MSNSNRSLTVLIGATLTMTLALGLRQSFGLYLIPITQTFGWSRETFSLAIALQMLLAGFGQPLGGAVADRYGSGRVVSLAAVGFGLSLLLMTLATTPLTFILTAGLLAGLSMGGMGTAVVLGAVGRTASETRRSMYFGIVTAGGSLGMFLLLPLGHFLISNLGWVAALTITGLLCLTIVPIGRLLRETPHPGGAARPSPLRALRGGRAGDSFLAAGSRILCVRISRLFYRHPSASLPVRSGNHSLHCRLGPESDRAFQHLWLFLHSATWGAASARNTFSVSSICHDPSSLASSFCCQSPISRYSPSERPWASSGWGPSP